jgi:hypothetical protein
LLIGCDVLILSPAGSLEPELLFNLAEKNKIALASDMYSTIAALKIRLASRCYRKEAGRVRL